MKNKRIVHIIITLAIMLLIFIQSAMTGDLSGAESSFIVKIIVAITGLTADNLEIIVRKAAHFTEFMLLGMSLTVNVTDFNDTRPRLKEGWLRILIPWAIGTLYAATDELHQLFVPGRACSITDVCIDSVGAAVGVAVMTLLIAHQSQNKKGS